MNYRYATVVKSVEYDPANDLDAGTVRIVAGRHEDGYSYTVLNEDVGGFVDIDCEVLGVVGPADRSLGKLGIKQWAANQPEAKTLAEEGASA